MERERDDRGQFADEIDPEDTLQVFTEREDMAEPITAGEVEEKLGWSRRTAHNKLEKLERRGVIKSKKIGARGKVWWVPISQDLVSLSSLNLSETGIPTTPEEILDILGDSLPGRNDETKRERAEVVLTAYRYLQAEGEASTNEIRNYTHERHPVEATDKQSGPERLWVNYLRDALAELPGVEGGNVSRAGAWRYIDPAGELAQKLDNVELDDWVALREVAGEGKIADRQRAMIQLAYDQLRGNELRKADFKERLPDYTAHYADFNGLWTYCIRDALASADDVSIQDEGRYTIFARPSA